MARVRPGRADPAAPVPEPAAAAGYELHGSHNRVAPVSDDYFASASRPDRRSTRRRGLRQGCRTPPVLRSGLFHAWADEGVGGRMRAGFPTRLEAHRPDRSSGLPAHPGSGRPARSSTQAATPGLLLHETHDGGSDRMGCPGALSGPALRSSSSLRSTTCVSLHDGVRSQQPGGAEFGMPKLKEPSASRFRRRPARSSRSSAWRSTLTRGRALRGRPDAVMVRAAPEQHGRPAIVRRISGADEIVERGRLDLRSSPARLMERRCAAARCG